MKSCCGRLKASAGLDVSRVKNLPDPDGLNPAQRRFINAYAVHLNGKKAAIEAGYSENGADVQASRLLANVKVFGALQKLLDKRAKKFEITQDQVMADLAELRDLCMGRKPIKITEIIKNAHEGTAVAQDFTVSAFEPTAANRALELMGKHIGMFKERTELTGPDGGPLEFTQVTRRIIRAPKKTDSEK